MRCVLASDSSSDLSSVIWGGGGGFELTRLLADAACRLARVGILAFLPELDFLT